MMNNLFLLIIILSISYITYLVIESVLILLLKDFIYKINKSHEIKKVTLKPYTQLDLSPSNLIGIGGGGALIVKAAPKGF